MKTKFTTKERLEIYKKATNLCYLLNDRTMCGCINDTVNKNAVSEMSDVKVPSRNMINMYCGNDNQPNESVKLFPEFMELKPSNISWGSRWFNSKEERIEAMKGLISGMEKELKIKK